MKATPHLRKELAVGMPEFHRLVKCGHLHLVTFCFKMNSKTTPTANLFIYLFTYFKKEETCKVCGWAQRCGAHQLGLGASKGFLMESCSAHPRGDFAGGEGAVLQLYPQDNKLCWYFMARRFPRGIQPSHPAQVASRSGGFGAAQSPIPAASPPGPKGVMLLVQTCDKLRVLKQKEYLCSSADRWLLRAVVGMLPSTSEIHLSGM